MIDKEVQKVLSSTPDQIDFEPIANESASPLNAPVIEKEITGAKPDHREEPEDAKQTDAAEPETWPEQEPLDAPEQEINEDFEFSRCRLMF